MATRVEIFTVTVPAGTLATAPVTTTLPFDIGEVSDVEIIVPRGPNGLVGFQIRHSGAGVYPREDDRWIITDDEKIRWPLTNAPTGRAWACRAYNTGLFDHSIYFRFLVHEVERIAAAANNPIVLNQPDQAAIASTDSGLPEEATL